MMELWIVLLILGFGFLILVKKFFPEAFVLPKGLIRAFIKEKAVTPEGANAVFEEKIDQLQDVYNKADNSLRMAAGRYESSKTELGKLQQRLQKVEKECENLVKTGQMEMAAVKAEERQDIIERIASVDEMVTKYEEATRQAKMIYEQAERQLKRTKAEQKETVQRIKDNQNLNELYDNLNDLKATDGVDKLLEAVRERDKELSEMTAGAKVIHQNKLDTKLQIAEKEAYRLETADYLNSLQAKYGTGKSNSIPTNKKAIPVKRN